MRVSVFTPTHGEGKYLEAAYQSLLAQTDPDWQWVVLYNNGAKPRGFDDVRVLEVEARSAPPLIGFLKGRACELARGDILLELDHDDMLTPDCVAEVKRAFAINPTAGLVYSNTIPLGEENFGAAYGWRYRQHAGYRERLSFAPTPAAVSRIWFAPDHVRAFRRDVYERVGGYNREMRVLDDQDLMARMYVAAPFVHIDKPLYQYRYHDGQNWKVHNAEIQSNVWRLYDKYAHSLAETWAQRSGLAVLDFNEHEAGRTYLLPDSSVGVIHAVDMLQRVRDPVHAMKEASRLLAPGGWLCLQVPSTDGRGAFQDPRHKSFWNENSLLYYTDAKYASLLGTPVRFQMPRAYTTALDAQRVCWVKADLINLKGGYRPPGLITI